MEGKASLFDIEKENFVVRPYYDGSCNLQAPDLPWSVGLLCLETPDIELRNIHKYCR